MLLLVTIRENVVYNVVSYMTSDHLERAFITECEAYGVVPCDANFDNGYMELEDGTSICMTSTSLPTLA